MTAGNSGPRDSIRDALGSLPRTQASEEFTRRVAARWAHEAPRLRRRRSRRRSAAAALIVLLAAAFAAVEWRERAAAREKRAALVRQHEELRRELDALRIRADSTPTLYLGAAHDFEVVLDLAPWMEPTAQPAVYTVSRP